jgi:hypothetical protein
MRASFLTLVVVLGGVGLGAAASPIRVTLAPVSAEALHYCQAGDVEKALTLRHAIDKALAERGEWLLAAQP